MNGLFRIFKTKPKESSEADKRWFNGYNAFKQGQEHFVARHFQDAVDCFDRAVTCGFENAELFGMRGGCLQSLDWQLDAVEDFTKAISLEPKDCNLRFQRAMSKISIGDKVGFAADLHDAVNLSQGNDSLSLSYNEGAKEMGWPSAAAMYEAQATFSSQTPDFIVAKNVEHAKLRGKRPLKENVA